MNDHDKKPGRIIFICGSGGLAMRLLKQELITLSQALDVMDASEMQQGRSESPSFDSYEIKPMMVKIARQNDIKQLRREQRARENRIRKMVPKGRR